MSTTAPRSTASPSQEDRLWTVEEHLEDILSTVRPLEPIELQLLDAQGCVLVEDVTVPVSLPPFDNSSMDGYAVRVADVTGASGEFPAVLEVVGDVAAGQAPGLKVGPGQAARIMTGAPLPPGAEAVVPVEWTDGGLGGGPATGMKARSKAPEGASGQVRVYQGAEAGAHVRRAGSDMKAGDRALAAGTVLGPAQLALLASVGRATAKVRPRPRVVVLSTGSELVPPGEPLKPGQIHDSNSFALTAAAREAGAIAYRVGAVADDAETLRTSVDDQLVRADLLVTSGGVSVGAYDVVKEALTAPEPARLEAGDGEEGDGEHGGAEPAAAGVDFRRVAMQPGKPQGFGLIGPDHTPVLTLPGNPVSSFVSFEIFVRPVIRALMGLPEDQLHRPRARAALDAGKALSSPRGRRQFLRGRLDGDRVTPVGGASSHLVGALAQANALIVVPEDVTSLEPGDDVEVVLLG
ncbi:molybdotransferase-like divisome protein Glp [Streptomyces fragilis]|uniref:Molybdopterin molybdenumtransferase n=1 Tax=Streptomyces fragilis TaxID=67301 RepID=A0ABV2YD17_9ACTN|nr:gephyrin-like molybdotransferase Glp [Streptomyces fragilis]